MRAIVAHDGSARLAAVPTPRPPAGWARLRVLLAGICRTDVHAAEGRLPLGGPRIIGHEVAGEVAEVGPDSPIPIGARVAVAPLFACGACAACGRGRRCVDPRMLGVHRDGAFAEEVVVPESALVRIPEGTPLRRAAYVEPLAAALAVTRAPIRADQSGAVVGDGRIADLTLRVLRRSEYGARLASASDDAGSFDYVVEATGTAEGLERALHLVAPGGVVVLKSRPAEAIAFDVARAVRGDVTLACVAYGSFDEAARLAAELPIDDLLGDVYPLERFEAAMAATREAPLGPKLFVSP